MLNFGPLAVPGAFFLFGAVVGFARRLPTLLDPRDSRLLLYPYLINFCVMILVSDSYNLLFSFFKSASISLAIVALGSVRVPIESRLGAARKEEIRGEGSASNSTAHLDSNRQDFVDSSAEQ
jgi:hypothetical protein